MEKEDIEVSPEDSSESDSDEESITSWDTEDLEQFREFRQASMQKPRPEAPTLRHVEVSSMNVQEDDDDLRQDYQALVNEAYWEREEKKSQRRKVDTLKLEEEQKDKFTAAHWAKLSLAVLLPLSLLCLVLVSKLSLLTLASEVEANDGETLTATSQGTADATSNKAFALLFLTLATLAPQLPVVVLNGFFALMRERHKHPSIGEYLSVRFL